MPAPRLSKDRATLKTRGSNSRPGRRTSSRPGPLDVAWWLVLSGALWYALAVLACWALGA